MEEKEEGEESELKVESFPAGKTDEKDEQRWEKDERSDESRNTQSLTQDDFRSFE